MPSLEAVSVLHSFLQQSRSAFIHIIQYRLFQGSCTRSPTKFKGYQGFLHSVILDQFNVLLLVDHSIAYSPTGTQEKRRTDLKHWCVIFISKTVWAVLLPALQQLRQFTQSPSLVETFMIDKFQTFQGLSLFFQNNSGLFSFWNSRTFQGSPWIQGRRRNPAYLCWKCRR